MRQHQQGQRKPRKMPPAPVIGGDGSPVPAPAAARSWVPTWRSFVQLLPTESRARNPQTASYKTDSLCGCIRGSVNGVKSNKVWVYPLGVRFLLWVSKGVYSLSARFFSSVSSRGCLLTMSSLPLNHTDCPLMTICNCKIILFSRSNFCIIQQTECN